jgi:hypothetical protein
MKSRKATPEFFILAAKQCEIGNLKELQTSCQLVVLVSDLVHALQRERGMTNVFIKSGGTRMKEPRVEQIKQCERFEQAFRDYLSDLSEKTSHLHSTVRLFNAIAFVLHALNDLDEHRHKVTRLTLTAAQNTLHFSDLISGLLNIVFEAADITSDPETAQSLVGLFNFMQGKEYAGLERAWGAIGFAAGQFSEIVMQRLNNTQEQQEHCFKQFIEFSNADIQKEWHSLINTTSYQEFERLRLMIQSSDNATLPTELSEVWYDIASTRIDSMHELELSLVKALKETCEENLQRALLEYKSHEYTLSALSNIKAPTSSIELSAHAGDSLNEAEELIGQNQPKSLLTLIQNQAAQLKQMEHELDRAKKSLHETKVIERAKAMLMQYQGLSEEQAHRQLQQAAMKSDCKLIDVAENVLSVSNVIKKSAS